MHLHRSPKALAASLVLSLTLAVTGCRSAYIDATVTNATAKPITLLQVDYPSASFGIQVLTPGKRFYYRFKVLGNGPISLTYTDATQHEHHSTGPTLHEGNQGALTVLITGPATSTDVHWSPAPTH